MTIHASMTKTFNDKLVRNRKIDFIKNDIKLKILQSLGMTEEESIRESNNPLLLGHQILRRNIGNVAANLIDETERDGKNKRFNLEEEKAIILPEKAIYTKKNKQNSITLEFTLPEKLRNVQSMKLWIFANETSSRDIVCTVFMTGDEKRAFVSIATWKNGWLIININPGNVMAFHKEGHDRIKNIVKFRVHCKQCQMILSDAKLPYLVYDTKSIKQVRQRRSANSDTNCDVTGKCCKEPVEISFNDINLSWVLSPVSFKTHKCTGTCQLTVDELLRGNKGVNSKTCCSPRSFEPLTMLHLKDRRIVKTTIENFIVTSCGCT